MNGRTIRMFKTSDEAARLLQELEGTQPQNNNQFRHRRQTVRRVH